MDGVTTPTCRAASTSIFFSSSRLLLGEFGRSVFGFGTVLARTRSELEFPNPATLQSEAIISVVIEHTATSKPMSLINNASCVSLK